MDETTSVTFRINQPHAAALKLVRKELAGVGLRISVELDIARRIRREMGAAVAPCVVLFVDDPVLLLEATVCHREASVFIPQRVVVSGKAHYTEVHVRAETTESWLPAGIREPLQQIRSRILRALSGVAEHELVPVGADSTL
jgi:uncharacterized protein (DUF302 family)